jgi:PIN domain nuclease of toxin-antitoxin system
VLIWWFSGSARISPAASIAIRDAKHLLVSPISWWEVGMLLRDGRIELDRPLGHWITQVMEDSRSMAATLSPVAAAWAGQIPAGSFPGDPADRLLYATARDLRVPLVTKDDRLRGFAARNRDVDVIW